MADARKEVDKLINRLLRAGWTVVEGKHRKVVHPSGVGYVTMSRTPSDYFALENIKADIRRLERKCSE